MRQIAATHRGDKSPRLHCWRGKSLRQDTCSVYASEFGRGEMWTSSNLTWRENNWRSLIGWFKLCRRSVHTLRQGCLRLFCRCDMLHEFKPVWIRATDRSDKILSQRQWFSQVTRGDLLQQHVAATCRIVWLGLKSFKQYIVTMSF